MGYKAHNLPGFPKNPVYLPDDIPVEIRIIPSSVAGWTSGQKLGGQTKTTWHDTGNPHSTASSEYTWAANGGRAGIGSPGSYNGIFDPTKIIITQRFDELVGHAGTAQGNRQGWAFEQAYGNGFEGGLRVGAALHGGIIAAMGWGIDALVQHNYWSGKHCPAQIRNRGLWPQVQQMVAEAARKARAAAGGVTPEPEPEYAKPDPITELASSPGYVKLANGAELIRVNWRVRTIKDTPRLRWASPSSPHIGPVIPKGVEFDASDLILNPSGSRYLYTPWHTRVDFRDVEVLGAAA